MLAIYLARGRGVVCARVAPEASDGASRYRTSEIMQAPSTKNRFHCYFPRFSGLHTYICTNV